MEKLFTLEYGVAGICVMLTLGVLLKVGEFLWKLKAEKEKVTEKTMHELIGKVEEFTVTAKLLDQRLGEHENNLDELPKLRTDLRRFYTAIKILAGDKWPSIRKEMDDEISL